MKFSTGWSNGNVVFCETLFSSVIVKIAERLEEAFICAGSLTNLRSRFKHACTSSADETALHIDQQVLSPAPFSRIQTDCFFNDLSGTSSAFQYWIKSKSLICSLWFREMNPNFIMRSSICLFFFYFIEEASDDSGCHTNMFWFYVVAVSRTHCVCFSRTRLPICKKCRIISHQNFFSRGFTMSS